MHVNMPADLGSKKSNQPMRRIMKNIQTMRQVDEGLKTPSATIEYYRVPLTKTREIGETIIGTALIDEIEPIEKQDVLNLLCGSRCGTGKCFPSPSPPNEPNPARATHTLNPKRILIIDRQEKFKFQQRIRLRTKHRDSKGLAVTQSAILLPLIAVDEGKKNIFTTVDHSQYCLPPKGSHSSVFSSSTEPIDTTPKKCLVKQITTEGRATPVTVKKHAYLRKKASGDFTMSAKELMNNPTSSTNYIKYIHNKTPKRPTNVRMKTSANRKLLSRIEAIASRY
jgi:hypothetical protein